MPHRLAEDMEEERRLAYVAVTRAKKHLCLSWAHQRVGKATDPSPYLKELALGVARTDLDLRGRAGDLLSQPRKQAGGTKSAKTYSKFGKKKPPASFKKATKNTKSPGKPVGQSTGKSAKTGPILVTHPTYGIGEVVSIRGDRYHVNFLKFGMKEVPGKDVRLKK
jgi:ATP-dependent exoDNAse (exonuclease V) beta subunit